MKSAQLTPTATPAKKNTSFFNKESEQGFFHPMAIGSSINEQPFFSKSRNNNYGIQTKLTVGEPNDIYEKEADSMADKVVQRLAQPKVITRGDQAVQTKPLSTSFTPFVQAKCAHCEEEDKLQKKEKEDDKDLSINKLQRKPCFENNAAPSKDEKNIQRKCTECEKEEKLQKKSDNSPQTTSPGIEGRLNSSKGSGSSLPASTREQMENSFGANFSNVRIHNDSAAVQMNKDLNAQAFTHGSDIYFNSGKYNTNSSSGKHLLAHELTHVLQQRTPPPINIETAQDKGPEKKDRNNSANNGPQNIQPPYNTTVKKNPGINAPAKKTLDELDTNPILKGPDTDSPSGEKNERIKKQARARKTKKESNPVDDNDESQVRGNASVKQPNGGVGKSLGSAGQTGSMVTDGPKDEIDLENERIKNAKDSDFKATAIVESAYLNVDSFQSQALIDQLAEIQKINIRIYFAEIRQEVNGFFIGKGQDILNSMLSKQAFVMQTTTAYMARITAFVNNITQQGLMMSTQIRESISTAIGNSANLISNSVNGIANQITGLISSMPLPNIPGINILRNAVISIINRISVAVRNMVNIVGSFLQKILAAAMDVVNTIVNTINEIIMAVLNKIFTAIMDLQILIFNKVNAAGQKLLEKLNEFLYEHIYPVIDKAESYFIQQVNEIRDRRKAEIKANQHQILKALADLVAPKSKPVISVNNKKGTREEQLIYQEQITQYGVGRNAEIILAFVNDTSSFLNIILAQIYTFIARLYNALIASINKLIDTVTTLVTDFIKLIGDLVQKGIDAFLKLLTSMITHLIHLVTGVATVVEKIGEKAIALLRETPERTETSVRETVSNFITSKSTNFAGGPVLNYAGALTPAMLALLQEIEQLAPFVEEGILVAEEAAEVVIIVEESAVVVEETAEVVVVGWEVILIIIVIILILIIIALLVYLIYLIIEEITKPIPVPIPVPIPIPVPVPVPDPDPEEPDPENPVICITGFEFLKQAGEPNPVTGASVLGGIIERIIEGDYCSILTCDINDYFDVGDANGSRYLQFLIDHNPLQFNTSVKQRRLRNFRPRRRPDMLSHKTSRKEVYEIKPFSDAGVEAGLIKLNEIGDLYNTFSLPYIFGNAYNAREKFIPIGTIILKGKIVNVVLLVHLLATGGLVLYEFCFIGKDVGKILVRDLVLNTKRQIFHLP